MHKQLDSCNQRYTRDKSYSENIISPPLYKFSGFSSNQIGLRCFLSPLTSSFPVFHVNIDTTIKSKERLSWTIL